MATTTLRAGAVACVDRSATRARELADFLRVHRARIKPEDAGFARGRRRRTPGLRREEVAHLAGVSVTWYTWLEQARPIRVSEETLESLARALRLTRAERAHLFLLGLGRLPVDPARPPEAVPAALRRLVDAIGLVPAFATGPLWELLAWNPVAAAVFGLDALEPADRNMLWYMFAHPEARRRVVHWEGNAQRVLAQFRAETARRVGDRRMTSLVERLRGASPEFAAWWPRHDVLGRPECRKEILHPVVGRLVFEHNALLPNDAPECRVIFYTPLDEEDTPEKLARLMCGS
ncbi:MAG TPA: helix-turn-helix transcriptional regulator [Longimicrobiales bacterium]